MIEALKDHLVTSQNKDGGWGALRARESNTEATALCLLGLSQLDGRGVREATNTGFAWLLAQQRPDGGFPFSRRVRGAAWTTPLAVLCLAAAKTHPEAVLRGARWLTLQKGAGGPLASVWERVRGLWSTPTKVVKLDPSLQGWAWTPMAFSWVEPTAYALIALKRVRPLLLGNGRIGGRLGEGELLLYDRMCTGGGWNFGNSNVLGEDLHPFPDTTAISLIALQDRAARPENQQSLRTLAAMLPDNRSGLALSWAVLCFSLYGREVAPWQELLRASYGRTRFLGETKTVALALLALRQYTDAFRV